MIEIKGDNLKYDHSNELYKPDAKDLGFGTFMSGFYTEDELREQLAKLVEANSFAGQGRLTWATATRGGFAALRDYFVVRTVNGQDVSKTQVRSEHAARMLIQQVTGRYGDWAVIPADRSIEELK